MSKSLYAIYGASGCGRGVMPVASEQLLACGVPPENLVFVDDQAQATQVNGREVMSFEAFCHRPEPNKFACIAIASGGVRRMLARRLQENGIMPFSARARNIVVMDDVEIGEGAILSPFVTITSNIRIGHHFHANLYSYIEHDCVIGDFVTFAPGVKCNGNIHIEDNVYVGSGAVIKQGVPGEPLVIGQGAVIGMGAVVTRSVPPGVTVVGNPARPLTGKR